MDVTVYRSTTKETTKTHGIAVDLYMDRKLVVQDNGDDGILITVKEPGRTVVLGHYLEPR